MCIGMARPDIPDHFAVCLWTHVGTLYGRPTFPERNLFDDLHSISSDEKAMLLITKYLLSFHVKLNVNPKIISSPIRIRFSDRNGTS